MTEWEVSTAFGCVSVHRYKSFTVRGAGPTGKKSWQAWHGKNMIGCGYGSWSEARHACFEYLYDTLNGETK